ncbi:AAA family ATPase [Desulfofundulus thermobenzoicus]|uniref:AAA family ATPase n=1 Tax=Desulfofundulus thermobenzoicus TaxID=29376 RepID=A0A6N7IVF0_9FIRM|nr:sigma 54-interacting transcriptional regulator [Desulfofundulus thermobenzoicus]MQL53417.1 AAA family ATPase [Desulfofundulus thermobenzoicus]
MKLGEKELKIKKMWETFIQTGKIEEKNILRSEVLESWKRCRAAKTDPFSQPNRHILTDEELNERRTRNKDYVDAATSILQIMAQNIDIYGFRFDIYDTDLFLLNQYGDEQAIKIAQKCGISPGVSREELISGTTVISLVDEYRIPMQLTGPEHYNINLHVFTCSAAPVFSPTGQYLGILSMSGDFSLFQKHTLGLVVAISKLITQSIAEREIIEEQKTSREYLNCIINAINDAIIVINNKNIITLMNKAAGNFFDIDPVKAIGASIKKYFGVSNVLTKVLETGSAIKDAETLFRMANSNNSNMRFVSNIEKININQLESVIAILKPMSSAKLITQNVCGLKAYYTFDDIIGESQQIKNAINIAKCVAPLQTTVLLQGESGTGKEVFAQAIHNASCFKRGPFVALNCAAIPGELIESELFGYEEGAFTGAKKSGKQGKFELAENGTLFLDEINSMPLAMQAKLLRAIQTKKITRLGGGHEYQVNVRIICAANRDLWKLVKRGLFREDLLYRIYVVSIDIPPLRERKDDIPLLTRYFCSLKCKQFGVDINVSDEVYDIFCKYDWPGNVRELENVIERAIVMAIGRNSSKIELKDISGYKGMKCNFTFPTDEIKEFCQKSDCNLNELELKTIIRALKISNNNFSKAAKLLGISRPTLYRRLKKFGYNGL